MKRFSTAATILLTTTALIIITSQSASAYIDPGTGSFALQALVATVLAAAFVVKSQWQRIVSKFTKSSGNDADDAE